MSAAPASPNQEGPSEAPPSLPEGWLAQWDAVSRKYYFVQRATGHSQWNVPDKPALSAPTPEPTPQAETPFQRPEPQDGETTDRGMLSNIAMSAIQGGNNKPHSNSQSGLGGLASALLSGHGSNQHSGGSSHSGGGAAGLAGQLIGGLLNSGQKPQNQNQSAAPQSYGAPSGGTPGGYVPPNQQNQQQHHGGLAGMASSFLGGHHGQQHGPSNYGYTSSGSTPSGGYTGNAPPISYAPGGAAGSQQQHQSSMNPNAQQPSYGQNPQYGGSGGPPPGNTYNAGQGQHSYPPNSGPPSQYGEHMHPHQQQQQQHHHQQPPPYPHDQQPHYGGPPPGPPGSYPGTQYPTPSPGGDLNYNQGGSQYHDQPSGPYGQNGPPGAGPRPPMDTHPGHYTQQPGGPGSGQGPPQYANQQGYSAGPRPGW